MPVRLMGWFALVFAMAVAQAQKPYATINYPNANHTELAAMTPSGDIVGLYVSSDRTQHGFLCSKGKFTSIDYPGAVARLRRPSMRAGEELLRNLELLAIVNASIGDVMPSNACRLRRLQPGHPQDIKRYRLRAEQQPHFSHRAWGRSACC